MGCDLIGRVCFPNHIIDWWKRYLVQFLLFFFLPSQTYISHKHIFELVCRSKNCPPSLFFYSKWISLFRETQCKDLYIFPPFNLNINCQSRFILYTALCDYFWVLGFELHVLVIKCCFHESWKMTAWMDWFFFTPSHPSFSYAFIFHRMFFFYQFGAEKRDWNKILAESVIIAQQ